MECDRTDGTASRLAHTARRARRAGAPRARRWSRRGHLRPVGARRTRPDARRADDRGAAPAGRVDHTRDGAEPDHADRRAGHAGQRDKVTVTNKASGAAVAGTLAADGSTWTSTAPLAYASGYAVGVDAAGADGTASHQDLAVSTLAPAAQAFPSFIPPPTQATVGVGQPIVVKFNHPVRDRAAAQRALTVTANPPQAGGWYWLSDTEAHYRPQAYWTAGSTITLKADLFGVDLGSGIYGETDRTETIHVHDAWVAKADGATEADADLRQRQAGQHDADQPRLPRLPLAHRPARDLRQAAQHDHGLLHVRRVRGRARLLQGEGRPRRAHLRRRRVRALRAVVGGLAGRRRTSPTGA